MHPCTTYYCIAMPLELWFERLDFDAFQQVGPTRLHGASEGHLCGVEIVACPPAWRECVRGFFRRERERYERVEGPDRPSVAGLGGGRRDGDSQRVCICRNGAAGALG